MTRSQSLIISGFIFSLANNHGFVTTCPGEGRSSSSCGPTVCQASEGRYAETPFLPLIGAGAGCSCFMIQWWDCRGILTIVTKSCCAPTPGFVYDAAHFRTLSDEWLFHCSTVWMKQQPILHLLFGIWRFCKIDECIGTSGPHVCAESVPLGTDGCPSLSSLQGRRLARRGKLTAAAFLSCFYSWSWEEEVADRCWVIKLQMGLSRFLFRAGVDGYTEKEHFAAYPRRFFPCQFWEHFTEVMTDT